MRLLLIAFSIPMLWGADDPRAIVRRAIEADKRNEDAALNYTYLQRQETRLFDGAGSVKDHNIRTWDVTMLEGSPYKRLVARDDRPLPPADQKKEEEALRRSIEQRAKESPAQRAKRIEEWRQKRERERKAAAELPDAFDFSLVGGQSLGGQDVYVIDATPKPGYKTKSAASAFLSKVKARLWIDRQSGNWVKVEMESLGTITLGGFLVRVSKGTRIVIEWTHVGGEVWLPGHVRLLGSARILLVKSIRGDIDWTFTNFKKFQVESRVVSTAVE